MTIRPTIARIDWHIHKCACEIIKMCSSGEERMLHVSAHNKFLLKKYFVFLVGLQNKILIHTIFSSSSLWSK